MTPRLPKGYACLACALVLPATVWAGVYPFVDGKNIPGEFGAGGLLATQRFQTGFGDDTGGNQWGWGSELDQLYVTNDDTYLYVGLTGNLENNGNSMVVFFDVDGGATGANTLYTKSFGVPIQDQPRFFFGDDDPGHPGFDNIQFDAGFAANYAMGWTGGSPLGSQTRSYYLVNWTTLDPNDFGEGHTNQVAGMMTAGDHDAAGSPGELGDFLATASLGILGGADNSGVAGVEGWTPDPNDPNDICPNVAVEDPNSQLTGFEFAIPLSLLGVGQGDSVCLFAIVSSSDGWFSNQLLPPGQTETEFCNIGNGSGGTVLRDFTAVSGNQYACYTIVADQTCPNPGSSGKFCSADIEGNNCVVNLSDLAELLGAYGTCPGEGGYNPDADLTDDGDPCIGLSDLAELLGQYNDDCN
jgi:hypothetical protein